MRKIYLGVGVLLSCLTNTTNAFSQKITLNWGEESKSELNFNSFVTGKNQDLIKLCFEQHGGFFSGVTVTPVLARYNSQLTELATKRYEVNEKNINFNNLMSIKDNLFLFSSQYVKEDKATSFYCQPLDILTLNPVGKQINLGAFEAINKSSQSSVGYKVSKDTSKVLMFGLSPYSKKENEKYYIGVYDNNMKKIWENSVELPYPDKMIKLFDNLIFNDGSVGVLIKHYDKEVTKEVIKEDGEKVPAYTTKLLIYSKGEVKPKEYIISLDNKYVQNIRITNDINNNLTLFGLYKEKYNGNIMGFFSCTVNRTTKEVGNRKMNPFPMDFLDLMKIDKQGSNKEKDPGLSNYFELAKIVTREDGSQDFILEYKKAELKTYTYTSSTGFVTTRSYWVYSNGDIIDICIKPNNTTVLTRIPKMQICRDINLYNSFQVLPYKNKLLVFYNDDKDNIDRDLKKKPDELTSFNKCALVKTVIDEQGQFTREMVYDHKNTKLTICISECPVLSNSRIGLYALKGRGLFSGAKDVIGILDVQ